MARPKYPSDKQDQFMVRLPAGMRDRIKVAAEYNNRSMNAEIVARLEATLEDKPYSGVNISQQPLTPEILDQLFGDVRKQLERIEQKVDRAVPESAVNENADTSRQVEILKAASDPATLNSVVDALKQGDVTAAVKALHADVDGEFGDALKRVLSEDSTLNLYANLLPKILEAKRLAEMDK